MLCFLLTGCMKRADLAPLPRITQFTVSSKTDDYRYSHWSVSDAKNVAALAAFMDSSRSGWTRAYGVGFGPPSPAYYAHLFEGNRYVGYFAIGAGALPGSAAFFQVRYGGVFAQKRITRTEANLFLALIGESPEL